MKEEVFIFSSIWHRNRIVFRTDNIENYERIFSNIRIFIPIYRKLIFCGDVPKSIKYIKGANILNSNDLLSLRNALSDSIDEEEYGAPPVQILFFNVTETIFTKVLRDLDRGWIAFTSCDASILKRNSFHIYEKFPIKDGYVYLIDPVPKDISLERMIIENINNKSEGIKKFIIQMKENEIYLAFHAIQDELKTKNKITFSYLSEILNMREKTLKKIIEIGKRETRMDLSPYIEDSPKKIIKFLKSLSFIKEVSLAAIFNERDLIGYAKFRELEFSTVNFLRLKKCIEDFSKAGIDIGETWYFSLLTKNKDILIFKDNYTFCFIFEKGMNFILIISEIKNLMESVNLFEEKEIV